MTANRRALADCLKESFIVEARFIYEDRVYGVWTPVDYDLMMTPNPDHKVLCVEHRVVDADGNQLARGTPRSTGTAHRRMTVQNGATQS